MKRAVREAEVRRRVEGQMALYQREIPRLFTSVDMEELRFRFDGRHIADRGPTHCMDVQLVDDCGETFLRHCFAPEKACHKESAQ
ncbi:hypothetical protein [Cupriavidus pampae]|uniref:hypothetical protein n=1 Tax=Cupriavidus pampae TaxID=659251 RepID=UPI001CC6CF71|nr:hypothetical protein [Cupriavidus pampae]